MSTEECECSDEPRPWCTECGLERVPCTVVTVCAGCIAKLFDDIEECFD